MVKIYYFEFKVTENPTNVDKISQTAIGLAAKDYPSYSFPGWSGCSVGYHGDDAKIFASSIGKKVKHFAGNPKIDCYKKDDVVGCGYNKISNEIFFTRNGKYLGVAVNEVKEIPLYPTVAMSFNGEELVVNFLTKKFEFDIKKYISEYIWK